MSENSTTGTPAGWYPSDATTERWWDGTQWGEATRPLGSGETAAAVAAPVPAAPTAAVAPKRGNKLGIAALIVGAVGFVFAVIPGFLVLGWILLPIALVLGIIAVCLRGRSKWAGITAIILAVVGFIAGVIVFFAVVATAFDESFSSGDTTVTSPDSSSSSTADEDEAAPIKSDAGTRENPLAFGSTIENDDWSVTLTGFTPDANAEVAAANMFNDEPGDGQVWVIVDASATYKGSDEGQSTFVQIDYVTADGTVISTWDNAAAGIDPRFGQASLYAGATDSGRATFLVPATLDGLIRVQPGMFADEVFFALP